MKKIISLIERFLIFLTGESDIVEIVETLKTKDNGKDVNILQ